MSRTGFFFVAENRLLGEFLLILTLLWIVQPQSIKKAQARLLQKIYCGQNICQRLVTVKGKNLQKKQPCVFGICPYIIESNDAVLFDKECE